MNEKKVYNRKVLVVATLVFLIPLVIQFFYNVEIAFIEELGQDIKDIIGIGVYLVFMTPVLILVSKKSFSKFIKRERETNIKNTMYILIIFSLIVATTMYLLQNSLYIYITAILFNVIFYSALLLFMDKRYEKKSLNSKISINDEKVAQFMNALGGKENVKDVSYELRRVKIELNDVDRVDTDAIKELGATGMFISGNKLQAIIGENAEELDQSLKGFLND